MAVYEGSRGIAALLQKIETKSKLLVGESAEKIATALIDDSPLGAEYYASPTLDRNIKNDVGDFKNSWNVGLGVPDPSIRAADTAGTAAVADAIVKGKRYNLEEEVYVSNNVGHADKVEEGWKDNPEYGWKAKDGYHVVSKNITTAQTILEVVANKVSKI